MVRPHRVDRALIVFALLLTMASPAANLVHRDVTALFSASAKADSGCYFLVTIGLMLVISLLFIILGRVPVANRLRGRWLTNLARLLLLGQAILGALASAFAGLVAATWPGVPSWLQTGAPWLVVILVAVIVIAPLRVIWRHARARAGIVRAAEARGNAVDPAWVPPLSEPLASSEDKSVPVDAPLVDIPNVDTTPPIASLGRARRIAAEVVLLGAFGLDLLLYSLVVPFLPAEAERLGASPVTTGALFAMYAAGSFAATPLAGWLTDRVGARTALLWGLVTLGASTLLFAFSPSLPLGLPGLFGARAAQGVASTFTWTAGFAILARLHSSTESGQSFARVFTITGLSALIGPPLGGALYSRGGFVLPFLVATGLVALDGLGRLLFLPNTATLPGTQPIAGSSRLLWHDSGVWLGLFAALAGALALSSLEPATPLLLGETLGLPAWGIGLAFGGLSLCFVLMQPIIINAKRRLGMAGTMSVGLWVTALCFVGITLATDATWTTWNVVGLGASLFGLTAAPSTSTLVGVLTALAVLGCGLALALVPAPELLSRRAESLGANHGVSYGAIYAAYNAAYGLGILFGPLATAVAVAERGIAGSFLLLALPPTLCALVLLVWQIRGPRSAPQSSGLLQPPQPRISIAVAVADNSPEAAGSITRQADKEIHDGE